MPPSLCATAAVHRHRDEQFASEVTVKGDDNTTRTLAMKDVKSIEYDDAPAPPQRPTASDRAGAYDPARAVCANAATTITTIPKQAAVTTKTYELAAAQSCRCA